MRRLHQILTRIFLFCGKCKLLPIMPFKIGHLFPYDGLDFVKWFWLLFTPTWANIKVIERLICPRLHNRSCQFILSQVPSVAAYVTLTKDLISGVLDTIRYLKLEANSLEAKSEMKAKAFDDITWKLDLVYFVILCLFLGCRVYEPDQFRLVQTNLGHTDAVRTIMHVPERNQVSESLCK